MRLIVLSLVVFFCTVGGADAKYSLCNKSSYALSAAIGYIDSERLATRGWWRLRPGQCKVVLNEQTNPGRYFVFAEAIPGHRGPLRTWSGTTSLCVENAGFFNLRNQDVCRDDPLRQRRFFDVEVTEAAGGNYQTDFTDARNFSVYSAEIAGAQRLLKDVGRNIGRVDGALGRTTRNEIIAYRRDNNLGDDGDVDAELIDALIEDANAREAKLGLFYCNKTDDEMWTAIAEPGEGDTYNSRGWWKLGPGACSKILKGELQHDHYYIYGVVEEGLNERRIVGGDKSFCINSVMFSVDDKATCADRDLDEALFRRINVGNAPSATFDFSPSMFVLSPAQ